MYGNALKIKSSNYPESKDKRWPYQNLGLTKYVILFS